MKVLAAEAPSFRVERAASALLHDEPNARVVAFHLRPEQDLPAHRNDSTVIVHVVEGAGTFRGEDGEVLLGPGETAVFAPGEEHGVQAASVPLLFLAVIVPGPAR